MTGYGRAEKKNKMGSVVVEVSTTNRRYLEISMGLPKELSSLEQELKNIASQFVKRGRLQLHIDVQQSRDTIEFSIDLDLAKKYVEALQTLCDELELKDEVTLKDMLSHKDILSIEKPSIDLDEMKTIVFETVNRALDELSKMRHQEGAALAQDILKRLSMMEVKVREIQSLAPLALQRYEAKLRKKLSDLLLENHANEERILREVALMAERLDITEEIVRLLSHFDQFFKAVETNHEPIGRLLDFLTQEMNREVTTIASKANDLDISKLTVEIRNELEKIREQVQNIE